MPIEIAALLIVCLLFYAGVGLVAAFLWLPKRLNNQDDAVRTAPKAVRLVWLPGMVALWPVLLAITNRKPDEPQNHQAGDA